MSERSGAQIEYVSLIENEIEAPPYAFGVDEGKFVIASVDETTPYIAALGLIVCKALIFYDPEAQIGLLAHIQMAPNPIYTINALLAEMRKRDLEGLECHILTGGAGDNLRELPKPTKAQQSFPTMGELEEAVLPLNPTILWIEASWPIEGSISRNVCLDVRTGKVSAISRTPTSVMTARTYDHSLEKTIPGTPKRIPRSSRSL